jgi:hypothetical protein
MDGFRRHALGCPRGRPDGVRRLDVRFVHLAFPVWGWGTVPGRGGRPARDVVGMVRPEGLGISAELAGELRRWAEWGDAHSEYGGGRPAAGAERRAWFERGRELAGRLAAETGAEVVYAWPADGADPDCPHCGNVTSAR